MKTVKPTCGYTCSKWLSLERRGKVKISCEDCRDRKICLTAT